MPIIGERVSVALEKILFGTDFSSTCESAASYAKALGLRFSSTIDIAHVFDPSVVLSYEQAIIGLPVNERRQECLDRLESIKDGFTSLGIKARVALPEGHRPYTTLLDTARDVEAELIIVGTESKSGVERFILGSTAENLIRSAKCPVLTVGPKVKPVPEQPLSFRTILYATDFAAEAAKAAIYALSFAEDSGSLLLYCYVMGRGSAYPEVNKLLTQGFEHALKQLIPENSYDWCAPECVVEHGDAATEIAALAKRVDADLIVLGARSASFWLSPVTRGVTHHLLAEAHCPVLTIS